MGVRTAIAGGLTRAAKAFGGPGEPPAMAQAAQDSQMGMSNPFAPGEPVGPYDGYSRYPRVRDYETGYNIATRPRTHERVSFGTLRGLIDSYDVATICIWHKIDILRGLRWKLLAADGYKGDVSGAIEAGMAVMRKPDGIHSFQTWFAKWFYDVLAYDAAPLYRLRNRAGRCIGLLPFDGTTLAPLQDYWGNPPAAPAEAYVQYVNGVPWNWLTRADVIYDPFRAVNSSLYGKAPIESIILNANTDLRFQIYFLQRFTEGNVPEAFASAPDTWSPDQIEQFQSYWDGFMYGDQSRKHQVRWLPGGSTFAWSNEKDFSDVFSLFLMRKTCLDEQTEILTRRGWVQFPKLADGEEVATRSTDGRFEWQKPTDYIAEPYAGDMVKFKSNSLDLLVTPDHRMLLTYFPTKKHPRPKEFIKTAAEIVGKGGYMIPMRSHWEGESPETFVLPGLSYDVPNKGGASYHTVVRPDVHIPMKTWIAFLGLWLAEGHVEGSKGGKRKPPHQRGRTHKVGISQSSESPYFDEIQALLDSLPFNWTRGKGHTWVCQDKRLHTYLAPFGNSYDKYVPEDVKNLSRDLLEILWAWACKGDGHHYLGRFWQMITASERMAGDWQEILQKLGRDASVSWRKPGGGGVIRGRQITNCRGTWIVRERTSPLRTAHGEMTPYEGMVYCVSVPNGVIYVRRNGRPAWVGNCASFHTVPTDLGFTETSNYSSGESQADVQHKVGELPPMEYAEEIFSRFLYDDLCLPVRFEFDRGEDQDDRLVQAQADDIYIKNGSVSASLIRELRFGEPEPAGQIVPRYIFTERSGPVPLAALMGVAGKVDPESGAPLPGVPLPHEAFTEVQGVISNPPVIGEPLAEQEYGPRAIPPGPPPQPVGIPEATDPARQVAKEDGGAPGITAETGITSYDLIGRDGDEDEPSAVAKAELAAFRRFRAARRKAGTWRDFEFRAVDAETARDLNEAARASVRKEVAGYTLSPRSGMISLDVPEGLISPLPGGVSDFHVTVCYLGQDVDDDALVTALTAARGAAELVPGPLDGMLSGISSFPPGDGSDGKVPAFIPVQLPGADVLRSALEYLSASGHPDWTPHVTVAYLEPGDALPGPLPPTPVTFTHLSVHRGDEVTSFPLGGDGPDGEGELVAKAGDASDPKAWAGWRLADAAVAWWAPRVSAAVTAVLTPPLLRRIARDYLAAFPAQQGDAAGKWDRNDAAYGWLAAWLAAHGVTPGLPALAAGITADSWLIGSASAAAAAGGTDADLGVWKPGDARAAAERAAALGTGAGLTAALASPADLAGGFLAAASRALAAADGDTAPETLGADLADAVTADGVADGVVSGRVCAGIAAAAGDYYRQQPPVSYSWVTDPELQNCARCLDNEASPPRPPGEAWPSGDVEPPAHDRCGCARVP